MIHVRVNDLSDFGLCEFKTNYMNMVVMYFKFASNFDYKICKRVMPYKKITKNEEVTAL